MWRGSTIAYFIQGVHTLQVFLGRLIGRLGSVDLNSHLFNRRAVSKKAR